MATHIDVLLGDYESVVRYNERAIDSDNKVSHIFPDTNSPTSLYYAYIAHNYHMLIYGATLGGMERKALEYARSLTSVLCEDLFAAHPDCATYLECYAALDIHVLVRFGRWDEIMDLALPRDEKVMLCRSASLRAARALSLANKKDISSAKSELAHLEEIYRYPEAAEHIIHNNSVERLLEVEIEMIRGEIAYFSGELNEAFQRLRRAVELQDALNYDEPKGKMQPIRHALGALLLKEGYTREAESTFRADLHFHPRNPWAIVGLIECLRRRLDTSDTSHEATLLEYHHFLNELDQQRRGEFTDYHITRSCSCAL
jgi:tetratricopeptide (TPR) repeat protein